MLEDCSSVPEEPGQIYSKEPIAAVGMAGGVLCCVARGTFQPLTGKVAQLVAEVALGEPTSLDVLFRRHGITVEDQELYSDVFEHLVDIGVLRRGAPA